MFDRNVFYEFLDLLRILALFLVSTGSVLNPSGHYMNHNHSQVASFMSDGKGILSSVGDIRGAASICDGEVQGLDSEPEKLV